MTNREKTAGEIAMTRVLARTLELTVQGKEGLGPKCLQWMPPTIEAITNLPWDDGEWQEKASPTSRNAASSLLATLAMTASPEIPAPNISPMWDGGICAEWHQEGIDLEIYAAPNGIVSWSFEDAASGEEHDEESGHQPGMTPESRLREYLSRLGTASNAPS